MIASLTGILVQKTPQSVIVDVHGVGYEVVTPLTTFYRLPSENETVRFWTHTHVREDALQLYGFSSREEKNVFLLLLGVSGIGPKLAINILSGLPLAELIAAVKRGDVAQLSSIPGIGPKTAARLALELKEKMVGVEVADSTKAGPPEGKDRQEIEDAVSALVNLGYKSPLAKDAVKKVLGTGNGGPARAMGIEDLIKESLKVLSRT
ncbi:MAG TPA: Holliday junction branch migration protein RuvA [Nitrospiria bacterium]|jgi:Holliday junction DNA helicase RuvA|nr:Holliday junction branch migration protein RuvA [Nitrospiria bacterium]